MGTDKEGAGIRMTQPAQTAERELFEKFCNGQGITKELLGGQAMAIGWLIWREARASLTPRATVETEQDELTDADRQFIDRMERRIGNYRDMRKQERENGK